MPQGSSTVPRSSLKSNLTLIKTANSISQEYIQASDELPLSGSGQGNGGDPISWNAHMEPFLTTYSKDNKGFSFEDPVQLTKFLK